MNESNGTKGSNRSPLKFRDTYKAELFQLRASGIEFRIAGTLDGGIDIAITDSQSSRTYNLTPNEVLALVYWLALAAEDVEKNCLYGGDALLDKGEEMRFDKVVASRGDAELNNKLDKLTTLLTLLIQKSHPSILADIEKEPPDKCVPDAVLRAEVPEASNCGYYLTSGAEYLLAVLADADDGNALAILRRESHNFICLRCSFGGTRVWHSGEPCPKLGTKPVPDTPAKPEGNGCSSSQLLPCGCRFNYCATDRTGPVFWNQFNGVVQCHMCGQTYMRPAPARETRREDEK